MNIKLKKFQFQFLILLVTCGISSGCLWTQTAAGKAAKSAPTVEVASAKQPADAPTGNPGEKRPQHV